MNGNYGFHGKRQVWIGLLLLGILAVGGACYLGWPAAETRTAEPAQSPAVPVTPGNVSAKPKTSPSDDARARERREKMAKVKDRIAEIQAQQKELMARVAKSAKRITPEMQQKMVDGYMSSHEPHYRDLFNSWNLDPGTQQQVLDIVRERETQRNAGTVEYMKSGDIAGGKKELDRVATTAEGQLFFLLGQDHFDQMTLLDKQMQEETLARIQQRMK